MCCDVSRDSRHLITGSADQTAKLWDVQSGSLLFTFKFDSPARSVNFAIGDKLAVLTTDPFMEQTSAIHVNTISNDPDKQTAESALKITGPQGTRINRAVWGPLNRTIISAGEDATICIWDSEISRYLNFNIAIDLQTGKMLNESSKETGHSKTITSLSMSEDGSHFLTGSSDKSAKVVIGGGQAAIDVTTTHHRAGNFESKFFHKVLEEEIGGVKGHFGPINALAINPDGRSFSSGGEDGYIRLHHFDQDYFKIKM
ncbi:hypothetical protein C5167_030909 [Papaver somniferum]|nr:hypothetical protein C5167_030909 [Papaver somniferum]